jgi:RNA polymerase sigma factor (sigma-70 family)
VSISRSPEQDSGHQARLSLASFELFYRRYLPVLLRYLVSQARDTSWALDIAQDAMLAACDNWDDLLTYDRPDAWIFKVATRQLRRLEAQARERCWLPENLGHGEDVQLVATTDPWVSEHRELVAALRALPRRQAEVIGLHLLVGYPTAETALILACGEGTVRTQLRRGLAELRRPKVSVPSERRSLR